LYFGIGLPVSVEARLRSNKSRRPIPSSNGFVFVVLA
jgi:hypothetical protein